MKNLVNRMTGGAPIIIYDMFARCGLEGLSFL